jgi:hypothetical protein
MAPLIEQRSEKIVPGVAVAIERFRSGAASSLDASAAAL